MGGPTRRDGERAVAVEAKRVSRKQTKGVLVSASSCRLKREDCHRTKHDSAFSKWEILVGPCDWENYSLKKDGAERYRIHNLPSICSCPGLYELGVVNLPASARKFNPKDIVVVYLGQAENVRTRLQQYGRTGSHLECGDPAISAYDAGYNCQRGSRLFKEIFSRGFSIMFRWAPMRSKIEAMCMEARLLEIFDYAWNRVLNDICRRDDILSKLDKITEVNSIHNFLQKLHRWKWHPLGRKQGIEIISTEQLDKAEVKNTCPDMVLKLNKSPVVLVQQKVHLHFDHDVCGILNEDGSARKKKPEEHKGKRISQKPSGEESDKKRTTYCGVVLEDGSTCLESPPSGRKRCNLHKGRRIRYSNPPRNPRFAN